MSTPKLRAHFVQLQELQDERSDWDHMLEKIKLLQRLDPDFPVPLEIFDSDTRLIKQGIVFGAKY